MNVLLYSVYLSESGNIYVVSMPTENNTRFIYDQYSSHGENIKDTL